MRFSVSSRAVSIRTGTRRILADRLDQIKAALARHHHVENEQIEMQTDALRPRVRGAFRDGDAIAFALQEARQQTADAAVVVDDEQMRRVVGGCRGPRSLLLRRSSPGQTRCWRVRSVRSTSFIASSAAVGIDHRRQKFARRVMRAGTKIIERARNAFGLQLRETHRERLALFGRIKQPLAPVALAFFLQNVAFVDELLEDAAERLLGDAQNVQQVRDLDAGIAIDEMQHPMVGAAKAKFGQNIVGIADEVPVGKEQKLDEVPHRLHRPAHVSPAPGPGRGF